MPDFTPPCTCFTSPAGCLDYLLSLALSGEIYLHTEIPIGELKKGEEIGEVNLTPPPFVHADTFQGMAGAVYRGLWKDKRVAIKEFRRDIRFEDFFRELCIMCVVHHENLIKYSSLLLFPSSPLISPHLTDRCLGGVTKHSKRIIVMVLPCVL